MTEWLLGVDVGASGSRLALVPVMGGRPHPAGSRQSAGDRLVVGSGGSDGAQVMLDLVARALAESPDIAPEQVRGAAAGIAGFATVVAEPDSYLRRLRHLLPTARVVLSADMVTAHLGALREGGAVLAAGTGSIALGTDLDTCWHRVDGWGHLIGDLGSGAWIGLRGLQLAAAAADGRDPSGTRLYEAIAASAGPITEWPAAIYRRSDRAGALAAFAPEVQTVAAEGDQAASRILDQAARHLADTLTSAFVDRVPLIAALVGGLVVEGSPILARVATELARRRPDIELRTPLGTPLDGAVRLAELAATDRLPSGGPLLR